MSKTTLKQAALTLQDTVTKFKTAQDGGTMSPEEVMEAVAPIIDMATTIASIGSEIQEGVPAENGIESLGNNTDNEGLGNNINNDVSSENPLQKDPLKLDAALSNIEEDEEAKKLKLQVSQLYAQIEDMKDDNKKEKLAQKYAQLWPVPMRESKMKEFMSRDGNVGILQAQVKEAEAIMGAQNTVRQAQISEGTFNLNNYDLEATDNISYGGKY